MGTDSNERRAHLDWMIEEFQDARRRRLVRSGAAIEQQPPADTSAGPELAPEVAPLPPLPGSTAKD